MHDEQMGEQKVQIARLLLDRMSRRFYPLACQSFAVHGSTVDGALFALFRKKGLPFAENRKVRNSIVRKYVHFRLELASTVVKEDSRQSPFLESTMKDNLDFDITRSFSEEFDGVRKALLPFRPPFAMTGAEVIPLLSLLSGETGTNLSSLADDFTEETKGYLEKVLDESHRFMEALSFCDPRFHDGTKKKIPFLLEQCICENLGMEQGGLVAESAQILMPLTEVTPFIARKEMTPGGARFFYHYLLFRAIMVSFFASYMWQDRKLKDDVYRGIMRSRPMVRLIRAGKAIHFLREEDLPLSQRLYLKIHMFMRQWAIFDPKNEKTWYRYYPNFTSYITDRMAEEGFEDRINGLLDEFCHTDDFVLSERDRNFLIQETEAFINTACRTMYFAYGIGFRKPEDFIASQWKEHTKNPLLKGMKKIFGL